MNTKTSISSLLFICMIGSVIAQTKSIDLLTIESKMAAPQKYDSLYSGTATEKNFTADILFPIVFWSTAKWSNIMFLIKLYDW